MKRWLFFGLIFALLAAPGIAAAGVFSGGPPGSYIFGPLPPPGTIIDLTETGPAGSCPFQLGCGSIEIFQPVSLTFAPQPGALIIGEGVLPTLTDPSKWSDVVLFVALLDTLPLQPIEGPGAAQLLSDAEAGFSPSFLVSLIQFACAESNPSFTCAFATETNPPTIYTATNPFGGPTVTYRIFSDAPESVPEPAALLFLGSGIAGLAGLAWRHGRSK